MHSSSVFIVLVHISTQNALSKQVLTVIPPALFKLRTGIYLQSPGTVIHHSVHYQIVIIVSDELSEYPCVVTKLACAIDHHIPDRTLLVGKCTPCSLTQIVVR